MNNLIYYIICILAIVIGIYAVKKAVSCAIRAVIGVIVCAVIAYIYFFVIH